MCPLAGYHRATRATARGRSEKPFRKGEGQLRADEVSIGAASMPNHNPSAESSLGLVHVELLKGIEPAAPGNSDRLRCDFNYFL